MHDSKQKILQSMSRLNWECYKMIRQTSPLLIFPRWILVHPDLYRRIDTVEPGSLVNVVNQERNGLINSIMTFEGLLEVENQQSVYSFIHQKEKSVDILSYRIETDKLSLENCHVCLFGQGTSFTTYTPRDKSNHWSNGYYLLHKAGQWEGEITLR